MLLFDEPTHTYTWNGKPVPNVTGILAPLTDYSKIPAETLEKARQEGQAIHKMVELDCNGDLDVASLPAWMVPVYKGWRDFRDQSGFEPILNEYRGYHKAFGYAGTLDLLCSLPKLRGWKGVALLDVKRSLMAGPVIGYQLAAYAEILKAEKGMPKPDRRGALRLGPDGKFRLEPFDKPSDFAMFLGCLTFKRAKEECNAGA